MHDLEQAVCAAHSKLIYRVNADGIALRIEYLRVAPHARRQFGTRLQDASACRRNACQHSVEPGSR
jgi:hypothetical protein